MSYAITPELVVTIISTLVLALLLITAVLRVRSREKVVFHLLLYAGLSFVLSILFLLNALKLPALANNLYNLFIQLAQLAAIMSFGALTLNFLKKQRPSLIRYWVVALVILGGWSLLAFNVLGANDAVVAFVHQRGYYLLSPLPWMVAVAGWLFALSVSLIALMLDFRKRQPAQYLNNLRYWLIALTILTGSSLFLLILPAFNKVGLAVLVAGSLVAGYTVLSYHTPDLQLLLGRALRYFSSRVILFAILFFSLALAVFVSRDTLYPIILLLWTAAGLAVILAFWLPPLWKGVDWLLTRVIFGKDYQDQRQIIRRYSRSISSVLDMNRLGDTLINLMIETLGIDRGIVFINESSGGGTVSLRALSSVGMHDLANGYFASDSLFVTHLREGPKILSQYDLDMLPKFRQLSPEERKWLAGLGMELYVPILRERQLIGLLAFGPRTQGTAYYEEDQELMIALADQAALAIDSARLFEQLAVINQEVGDLTNRLAGLDQDKSDFLSIASHELRTPLTHIHGYSRMLLDLTEEELQNPEYVKTIIEGIAKGSDRMKDVVDLMFNTTEVDEGDINLFLGPVNLAEMIEQAARPFLPAFDQRRIALQKKGLKDLPTVEADGTRLMQAFENLIGNAIKYNPDGGMVTIEGRSVVLDNIGQAVEITVADTGIGIDSKHHERIFEKFFRVDDTAHHSTGKTKFKGAGPGLGLTLVKGIAEAHGGKVWVESLGCDEVNFPGSKFFFVIPLHAIQPGKTPQSLIETRHWRHERSKTTK